MTRNSVVIGDVSRSVRIQSTRLLSLVRRSRVPTACRGSNRNRHPSSARMLGNRRAHPDDCQEEHIVYLLAGRRASGGFRGGDRALTGTCEEGRGGREGGRGGRVGGPDRDRTGDLLNAI